VGVDAVLSAVSDRRMRTLGEYAAVGAVAIVAGHLRSDPRDLNTAEEWAFTGSSLVSEHRLPEAEAAYRRALGLDPQSGLAWDGLGLTLYDAGRLAEARTALERAQSLDRDSARALFHLGLVDEREGRRTEAAANYGRALELSPFDVDVARHLGPALLAVN